MTGKRKLWECESGGSTVFFSVMKVENGRNSNLGASVSVDVLLREGKGEWKTK
jgi:hypothetical protein